MSHQFTYDQEAILTRIASGDQDALRILIVHYTPLLGPYIYTFTQSKEQEEEVLQDIFLQVWHLRETFSTIQNFQGFLYSMARHHALNALRTTMREYARRYAWHALQTENSPEYTDRISLIEAAVGALPPQQKKAWIMSRRKGMQYAAIATEMKVSKETVKKHIQRANEFITSYVLQRADLLIAGLLLTGPVSQNIF